MKHSHASGLLQQVAALAYRRDHLIGPRWLSIAVDADLSGTITRQCDVADEEILRLVAEVDAAGPFDLSSVDVPLPVCALADGQAPDAFTVTLRHCSATVPLHTFESDELLRRVPSDALPTGPADDLASELVAMAERQDLERALGLAVSSPLHLGPGDDAASHAGGRLRRWLAALYPVGVINVAVPPDVRVGFVELRVPPEIEVDHAILTIDTGLTEPAAELAGYAEAFAGRQEEVERTFLEVQLRRLIACLQGVGHQLVDLEQTVEHLTDDLEYSTRSQATVHEARLRVLELLRDAEKLTEDGAALSLGALADLARRSVDACAAVRTVRLAGQVDPVEPAEGRYELRQTVVPRLRRVTLVFSSTPASIRRRHLSTRGALLAVSTVLLLLASKVGLGYAWPGGGAPPADVTDALDQSRDSIVAVLVVFPSLLYATMERIGQQRRVIDRATGVALATASLAVLAPVAIATLVIGPLSAAAIARACIVVGLGLCVVVAGLTYVLRADTMARRRYATSLQELEA